MQSVFSLTFYLCQSIVGIADISIACEKDQRVMAKFFDAVIELSGIDKPLS
jgi:hypothetical protein